MPYYRTSVMLCAAALLSGVALAESPKQFATVTNWVIMKREVGTCFAVTRAAENVFFIFEMRDGVFSISLANQRFEIPSGEYPVGFTVGGTQFFPAVSDNVKGVVQPERRQVISINLSDQQIRNFLKASWIMINLGGRNHMLSLSLSL